jgi:hypothetical protein
MSELTNYSNFWDAELGRVAMQFVDRAGDVHPGVDSAEKICAEFHAAMVGVLDRIPHIQRMRPAPQSHVSSVEVMLIRDTEGTHSICKVRGAERIIIESRVQTSEALALLEIHSARELLSAYPPRTDPTVDNLWALLEHNILHFGYRHSTVQQLCQLVHSHYKKAAT